MYWLSHVIGKVINLIRPATRVSQVQDIQDGGKTNTAELPQPVQSKPKRKRSAAQSTTPEVLPKRGRKVVRTEHGEAGKQVATPASKTRQPAKQAQTPKRKAAALVTSAKKRTQGTTPAPTRTVRRSKASGS